MMGWVILALLMAATFAAVLRLGVPRVLASFVGAALMLGAAGYALQGRPGLAAAPAATRATAGEVDPALSQLRLAMFGRYTTGEMFFVMGDALARSGDLRASVRLYLGATNAQPGNVALWTALGSAIAEHDGNTVSPPARLAFEQAIRLAPRHPGPTFFLGLAYVRAGEFRTARRWWRQAYALTPPGVSYRADIARRLVLLDLVLASPAGRDAR